MSFIREVIPGNANREVGKGRQPIRSEEGRQGREGSQSDVSKPVTMGTTGAGSCWGLWESGQGLHSRQEGPGSWGVTTSTPGCHWLGVLWNCS